MKTANKTERRPRIIMLVEDNPQDREATIRAFRKSGLNNPIVQCEDGEEALDYLFRRGQFIVPKTSPRPGVILLDLNMPGTDGFGVLVQLKADPELRMIPVVILTTSTDFSDIDRCYAAGASSYVQKPVDFEKFATMIKLLKEYWFEVVILPNEVNSASH